MILTIILFLITGFTCYLLFLALRRISQLERVILEISTIVDFIHTKTKQLDSTGHFEADDEIGFFFEEVKRMTDIMNDLFNQQEEQQEEAYAKKEK